MRRAILCCPAMTLFMPSATWDVYEPHGQQLRNGDWNAAQILDRNYLYTDGSAYTYIRTKPGAPGL
jgi:hypothetical protein